MHSIRSRKTKVRLNLNKSLFLFLFLFLAFSSVKAQYTKTERGILIPLSGQQVELAVANESFRVSVSPAGATKAISSIFLDENQSATTSYKIVAKKPVFGLKTDFGQILVNIQTNQWMLLDAKKNVLISGGTFSTNDSFQAVGFPMKESDVLYGAGNFSSKNLMKDQSVSQQGNGTVDVPYLWSTAGYCVFGVTHNDNTPATWIKSDNCMNWKFKGASADMYLWPAATLYAASKGYIALTGKPKLPPRWAFGYIQTQWGWQDRAYIENVLKNFRSRKHPVDAFVYDFEWYTPFPDYFLKAQGYDGFPDFKFHDKLFNEPAKQIAEYKKQGVRFVGIRKPRLGSTDNIKYCMDKGWMRFPEKRNSDEPNPGYRDMDFSQKGMRDWYGEKLKPLLDAGVDAWWNDEGEQYYSCYYWWNRAESDILGQVRPNDRHFSINRAFSPGSQRLGFCTWTGDIKSTWQELYDTPAHLLNYSLSGMIYGTCDIGGFGTKDPTKENLVRWYQAGTFFPIMRAHSNCDRTAHFPWLWGEDSEIAIRKALNLRQQLVPFIYSLGHEAYNTGAPIMRPLIMEFPNDAKVTNMTDQWLLGKGFMAAPILNEGGKREIYLPADLWYDFFTNEAIIGPKTLAVSKACDETAVYVRAGTILPLGPVLQYAEQDTVAPLEVRVYPGKDGRFILTEDDGTSYDYTRKDVRTTTYIWSDAAKELSWKVEGSDKGKKVYKTIRVVIGDKVKEAILGDKGAVRFI